VSDEPATSTELQELFLVLRALDSAVRAERLQALEREDAAAAREIAELLRADETNTGFLETPALGIEVDWNELESVAVEPAQAPPARIGRYVIESVLGRGGMGVVYRAAQEAPHRTVALKVLDGSSRAQLRRFEHEAELLARLQHPGIAQVFEAGSVTSDGQTRAFIAMELVPGSDLRAHLARSSPDPLARLALFVRIAEAVAHAHQKGVVHRDLKPENILVDAHGAPKIVDFGVARWLGERGELATLHTEAGRIIGTPWYMSPEQLSGDPDAADTRSDVYALGVIGYELFAGRLPYALEKKPLAEVARLIRDAEPARLTKLERELPDLAVVLAKCLEKEPARRYGSASELAADLGRVQRSEPISARAPSGVYLLQKFVRRNRALTLAAALAILTLVLGVAGFALQARRVGEQRDRAVLAEELAEERLTEAQAESRKFEQGFTFLNRLLSSVDPNKDGQDARVADLLARAGTELAGSFPEEPELEADMRRALGGSWHALGKRDEALGELQLAMQLLERSGERSAFQTARNDVALLLTELGRFDEARPLYRAALAEQEAALGAQALDTLITKNNLAALEMRRGELVEAERLYREVLSAADTLEPSEQSARLLASSRRGLADMLEDRGALAEARELLEQALADLRASLPERDTDVLGTLANLAALEASAGQLPLAIEHLEQCRAAYTELLPPTHPSVLTIQGNLGTLLRRAGRLAESEPLLRAAYDGRRATLGPEHQGTLTTANNLGGLLLDLGRVEEAEALLRETRDAQLRTLPPGHWMPHATGIALGECWSRLGRTEDARALAEESLDALKASLGPAADKTKSAARLLARLSEELGLEDDAARLRQEFALGTE